VLEGRREGKRGKKVNVPKAWKKVAEGPNFGRPSGSAKESEKARREKKRSKAWASNVDDDVRTDDVRMYNVRTDDVRTDDVRTDDVRTDDVRMYNVELQAARIDGVFYLLFPSFQVVFEMGIDAWQYIAVQNVP
jgi:hypothetical protein